MKQLTRRLLLAGVVGVALTAWTRGGGYTLGTTYYVDTGGNDAHDGLTPATAWQTIGKVNTHTFVAGDRIIFTAGQTFNGALALTASNYSGVTPPTSSQPVIITSGGGATIRSGNLSGFSGTNIGNLTLSNLTFVGGGITSTTVDGVTLINNQAGNARLANVTLRSLNVSAYGGNGISFLGSGPATAGFDNVTASSCNAYGNTGGTINSNNGTAGIYFSGINGYGQGATTPVFTGVTITGCTASGNTGKTGATNWTGSGIFIGQCTGGTISNCIAAVNGVNSNGTVGIWTGDTKNIVITNCESYGTKTSGINDGDGFDIDGGCVNCTIEYCYSHDNDGAGFQVYSYNDGIVTSQTGPVVRYCISQNDGVNASSTARAGIQIGNDATLTGVQVYGNTVYQSVSGTPAMLIEGANKATITGNVCNNILQVVSGIKFLTHTPAGTDPSGLLFNGNNYYTPGTFSLDWSGTNYGSLSAWQTASGQEKIGATLTGSSTNPNLTSPGGGSTGISTAIAYELQHGSPMIGTGINLQTQFGINQGAQDFFGDSIPNGSGTGYNVGADGAAR